MVRSEPTADASLAAMRERSKFGMAIAAMIRMIATTICNSMSEKAPCAASMPARVSSHVSARVSGHGSRGTDNYVAGELPCIDHEDLRALGDGSGRVRGRGKFFGKGSSLDPGKLRKSDCTSATEDSRENRQSLFVFNR